LTESLADVRTGSYFTMENHLCLGHLAWFCKKTIQLLGNIIPITV